MDVVYSEKNAVHITGGKSWMLEISRLLVMVLFRIHPNFGRYKVEWRGIELLKLELISNSLNKGSDLRTSILHTFLEISVSI